MGYCTHESRLVLRSAEIQPFIPRFVRFSCAIDLCRLIVQICTPPPPTHTHTHTSAMHIGWTHTHLPCCATCVALHTPTTQHNAPASYPSQQCLHLHTYACVCACARMLHRETTTRGFFFAFFPSRVTGCSTHLMSLTTCAFHVENSFSDPILEPGVLHISPLTSMLGITSGRWSIGGGRCCQVLPL